jgi:hypothetical protein
MESDKVKDPKDEKIINKDTSVTNKDGDNDLEKGSQPTEQKKPDEERVTTVTPDNDNGEPGPPVEENILDENISKDGQGPSAENL